MKKLLALGLPIVAALGLAASAQAINRSIHLVATDGEMTVPGRATPVAMRGFVDGNLTQAPGTAVIPAPIVDVDVGDNVFVTLTNVGNLNPAMPADPHTIHWHGIATTTQNDGFPETSWEVPVPGTQAIDPLTGAPVTDAAGNPVLAPTSAVYYFLAEKPGTYMYHCHVEASEHVQFGMYGALIIRPAGFAALLNRGIATVYGGGFNDKYDVRVDPLTGAKTPLEYVLLISDLDTLWHDDIIGVAPTAPSQIARLTAMGGVYQVVGFKPDYWLLNGRSFPDTLAPLSGDIGPAGVAAGPPNGFLTGANNWSTYDPFVQIPNFPLNPITRTAPRVLLRIISLAYEFSPFHIHGWHSTLVGVDAEPVPLTAQKMEMTIPVASGKTYDTIIQAVDRNVGLYAANSTLQGSTAVLDPAIRASLTSGGTNPAGNLMTEMWYPIHDHHDYKVTNDGLYPGGALTLIWARP